MERLIQHVRLFIPFQDVLPNLFQIRINKGKIINIEADGEAVGKAKTFDGKGKTVTCSFKDSHLHLVRYGLMKDELDLREINKWSDLKKELKNAHDRQKMDEDKWLIGRGLTDNHFKDRNELLTKKDLDELKLPRPVFLLHQDGHECVLNSEALKIVQKDDILPMHHKEFIEMDDDGNWTGRFTDTAVHFIKKHFRNKSKEEAKDALLKAFPHFLENGITHVHPDDLNYIGNYNDVWNAYRELDKDGKLPLLPYLHHYIFRPEDLQDFLNNFEIRSGDREGHVKVGAVKIFVDGTYRLHTAALGLPYDDRPTRGNLVYKQEELNGMVQLADHNNMQVTMHCIGDRAVESAIRAIMNTGDRENRLRHRIIHMQNTRPDLLQALRDWKIPVETQPSFVMKEHAEYPTWLGEERCKLVQCGQSLVKHDVIFTASSDTPIGPLNPHHHIFAAVNRTTFEGEPKGGWQPHEKLTVDQAYHAYCTTPAYLSFDEDTTGQLMPGFNADLMLLDRHPKEVDSTELKDIKVDALWREGELVFHRN